MLCTIITSQSEYEYVFRLSTLIFTILFFIKYSDTINVIFIIKYGSVQPVVILLLIFSAPDKMFILLILLLSNNPMLS